MDEREQDTAASRRFQGAEVLAVATLALVLAIVSLWRPVGWFAVVAAVVGLALGAYGLRARSFSACGDLIPGGGDRPAEAPPPSSWALGGLAASGVALVLGLITAVGLVGGSSGDEAPAVASPPVTGGGATLGPAPTGTPAADPTSTGTTAAGTTAAGTPAAGTPATGTTAGPTSGPTDRAPTVSAPPGAPLVPGTDPGWSRPPRSAALGETVQLITKKDRVAVDVTATALDKDASAVPATLLPTPGHRFFAVSYTVRAPGPASYAQPPSSQLCRLITADGVAHRPSYFMAGNGPALDAAPLVAAGSSATGWVLFEIPEGQEPVAVSYSPTAEWRL